MAKPVGIAARPPGAMITGASAGTAATQIETGGEFALVGGKRQVVGVRQPHDPEFDFVHLPAPASASAIRATSACATCSLRLWRPGFDPLQR